MTPAQVKAARKLLGWTRNQLSGASGVPDEAIAVFERGAVSKSMTPKRLAAVRATLEAAGIVFTDGDAPGVRLMVRGQR